MRGIPDDGTQVQVSIQYVYFESISCCARPAILTVLCYQAMEMRQIKSNLEEMVSDEDIRGRHRHRTRHPIGDLCPRPWPRKL